MLQEMPVMSSGGGGAVTFEGFDNTVNCYSASVERECTNAFAIVGTTGGTGHNIDCIAQVTVENGVIVQNDVYNSTVTFAYSSGKLSITKGSQIGTGNTYYYVRIMYS